MASFQGTDGDDIFTFPANTGDDDIEGEGGNDQLFGGAGDDHVDGYDGNDIIDGGAGQDRVRGQKGDDLGLYTLAENTRAPGVYDRDVYDGGAGSDTLRLRFTAAEFIALQSNIVALESFIKGHQNTSSTSTSSDVTFKTSFGLEARNWEKLEVIVDGEKVDPRDPAPRLDLDADDSTAPGTAFKTTFIEGEGRVAVVDGDVRVLELGGQKIQSATLTLVLRPDGDSESLDLSDEGRLLAAQLGVELDKSQPEGDSGPFVLKLTGAASAADYERLLRAVEYNDRSQDPEDGDRAIQVVVSDGKNASNVAVSTVSVVGVNDPPVNAFPDAVAVLEEESVAIAGSVSDPDAGRLRVTLEVVNGTLTLAPTDSVTFLEGDGTDDRRIVMEGSPDDLNQRLAGLVYTPDEEFAGNDRLSILTNDLGRQGIGGSQQDLDHVDIRVAGENDEPTLVLLGDQVVMEDSGPQGVAGFATALPGGGEDEGEQTFVYTVDVDRPELFAAGPVIDANGNLTYTPNDDAAGTATIRVKATDSGGADSDSERFQITINPVNDRPTFALEGNVIVAEDSGPQSRANFAQANPGGGPDEHGQGFLYTVNADNPGLFAEGPRIAPNGRLTFTPARDATGTSTVTVQVTDDGGTADGGQDTSKPQTFTITVNPVNDAPSLAILGNQVTTEDAPQQVVPGFATALPGGGSDEATQTFAYRVLTMSPGLFAEAPAISPNGTLTYTPRPDAAGTARVLVAVVDSGGSSDGGRGTSDLKAFTITINPVNDAPTFSLAESPIVAEDAGLQEIERFATADPGGGTDEQGQTFAYTVVANTNQALFAVGPAIGPDGTLTFTPQEDANGVATIEVFVTDSGGTAGGGKNQSGPQTFTITVNALNDPPMLRLQGDQVAVEDSGVHNVPGFATASPGGGPDEAVQTTFKYSVDVTKGSEFFEAGPVISPAGLLSYTLKPDAAGTAEISVTVTDSGGRADGGLDTSLPQIFTITINPVNDRPTLALQGDLSVLEDAELQTVEHFAIPDAGGGADEARQTFQYTVTNDNPDLFVLAPTISSDGTLRYKPNPDFTGEATVKVLAIDSGGTADGGRNTSAPASFTIRVNPVNDAPDLTLLGNQMVLEDHGPQAVAHFAAASPGGGPDERNQAFSYAVVSDRPELFAKAPAISPAGDLTYTPAPDAVGTAKISVQVTDSGGSAAGGDPTSEVKAFTITLNPVNDQPSLTVLGDQIVAEDSGVHSVADFAHAQAGGGPDERFQKFSYEVLVPDPSERALFTVGPQIDETGRLVFETSRDGIGTANVVVRVTDDGGTADGGQNTSVAVPFRIVVNPVNDPPSFTLLGNQAVLEDCGPQSVARFAVANPGGGQDERNQTFSYAVTSDRPELFTKAPAISAAGDLTYTPAPDAVGIATVSVQVTDSGGSAEGGDATSEVKVFTIALNPVNDRPSLAVAGDQIVNEDSGVHSVAAFAHPNPGGGVDERSQRFSYEVTTDREELFAAGPQIDDKGQLVFKTQADLHGIANVSVRVIDDGGTADGGQNRSDPAVKFRIVVNPVNDAPTLTLLGDRIVVEDSGSQIVAGYATAEAGGGETGQAFTYNVTTDKRELFADGPTLSSDGTLIFTPQRDASGTATVSVTATDSGGTANGGQNTSAPKLFTITVNPVNDKPSLALLGDRISNEDAGLQSVPRFATASAGGGPDEAQQGFSYTVTTDEPSLFQTQPTIAPDGTLSYATQKDSVGTANVTVTATDSGGTANGGRNISDPQRFAITVNPVNDAPSFTVLGNQITVEDAGPRSVGGFAKPQAGGGPDETGQSFFYNVVSTNTQLFAAAPAISPAGVLTYTPAADANGVATVLVSVTDSGGTANGGQDSSSLRSFTITVNKANDPPVLVVGGDQSALEDARVQVVPNFAQALPGGGLDEIGQTFSYQVNTNALELFAIAPTIDSFGRLVYQPKPDAVGTALVQVIAVDDGGTADGGNPFSDPRTFAIRISGVNDAPLLTLGGNRVANEDSAPQTVTGFAKATAGGGVDEQGQTFSYDVRTDKLELFADAPAVSPTGTLTFTPAKDAIGVASVEVTVIDSGGTANGGQNTSLTQTFTISLGAVNDPPRVTLLGNRSELEDGLSRTVPHFATASPGGGSDESTQKVSFSVVENDNPSLFAVAPSIDALGNLTYTLNPDAVGSAHLRVVGTDTGGTANGGNPVSEPVPFTITVNPVNDRPSLSVKGAQIVNEDTGEQRVLDFATPSPGGGADENSQTFSYSVTTNKPWLFAAGPSINASGDLVYTPQRDTIGVADVSVTVTDSGGTADGGQNTSLPATFSIAVNPVNDPPAFALLGDLTILEDAPAQTKTAFAVGNPGGGPDEAGQKFSYTVTHDNALLFKTAPLISDTGTLTYQVNPDVVGKATVTVFATDDGGTANGGASVSPAKTFRIAVNPVNDAPTLTLLGDLVIFEDASPQSVPNFARPDPGGGPDEDGQAFTYTTETNRPDLFAEAPTIDPNGTLRYTPRPNASGLATVSVRVTDDGGTADGGDNTSDVETFTIFVDPINDAPVNHVPSLAIPSEDQPLVFASQSGGRISVSDADAQTLEVSLSVAGGTLTVTTSEGFELSSHQLSLSASPEALNQLLAGLRYTPNPDFYGTDRLSIVARDHGERGAGGPLQDVDTVTLSVQPVNDAPFISVPGMQLAAGDSLVFSAGNSNRITIDDSDAGASDLAATLSVSSGTLSIELDGLRFSGDRLAFGADLAALNDALDGLVYVPDPGTSHDRLELLVDDQGNTGRGGALHHSAAVDILVTGDGLGLVGVPDAGDLHG